MTNPTDLPTALAKIEELREQLAIEAETTNRVIDERKAAESDLANCRAELERMHTVEEEWGRVFDAAHAERGEAKKYFRCRRKSCRSVWSEDALAQLDGKCGCGEDVDPLPPAAQAPSEPSLNDSEDHDDCPLCSPLDTPEGPTPDLSPPEQSPPSEPGEGPAIQIDPQRMGGAPCIGGHRITVDQMLANLEEMSVHEFADDMGLPVLLCLAVLREVADGWRRVRN